MRRLAAPRPFVAWSDLKEQAEFWEAYVRASVPRVIRSGRSARPVLLFCDAAAEEWDVGLAGVIIDPVYGLAQFWSHRPEHRAVSKNPTRVIAQAELVAVALSLHTWAAY